MDIKKAGQVSLFVVIAMVLVAGIILVEVIQSMKKPEIENKTIAIDRCTSDADCVADSCFATGCTTVGEMPDFTKCTDNFYITHSTYDSLNINIPTEYRVVNIYYNDLCPEDKRKQLLCGYYGACRCLYNKCVAVFP